MKCTVKVNINNSAIRQIEDAQLKALDRLGEAILSDMKARCVIPKDTGELERSGFVKRIDCLIVVMFDTPYARRWYFNREGVNFQKTKNPNAQDHWMDYYLDGEGLEWLEDTFTKFLKEESGGLIK